MRIKEQETSLTLQQHDDDDDDDDDDDLIKGMIFGKNFFVQHFSFQEELSVIWSQMDIGLQVIYSLFMRDFEET